MDLFDDLSIEEMAFLMGLANEMSREEREHHFLDTDPLIDEGPEWYEQD